jgi:hypothetical protein
MAPKKSNAFPSLVEDLKSAFWLSSFSLIAVIAGNASPAFSAVATFDLKTSPTAVNGTSLSFTTSFPSSSTVGLNVDNPSGGPFPSAGGVNSSPDGLCSWLQHTNTGLTKRCNYIAAPATDASTLTGYQFTFDKTVKLKQFEVSQFIGMVTGSIAFGGSPSGAFSFSGTGLHTFASDFVVYANTPLVITTSGTLSTTDSGVFRIDNLQVEEVVVPGPLPLLGAGTAFQFSRRLRKRMKAS